jgi:hypothetical protein
MICDVTIDSWSDSGIKETRGYRRELKRKGKKVRHLREDTLHNELFVFVGAKMSVASVAKRLREVADYIEKQGMLVGMNKRGDYICETVDGSVVEC